LPQKVRHETLVGAANRSLGTGHVPENNPPSTPTIPNSHLSKFKCPFSLLFLSTDGNSAIEIQFRTPSIRCDSDLMNHPMESVSSCPLTVMHREAVLRASSTFGEPWLVHSHSRMPQAIRQASVRSW
jgi:hypothetical protein